MPESIAANPATDAQPSGARPRLLFAQWPFNRLFFGSLTGTLGDRLYQAAVIAAVQLAFKDASSPLAWITLSGVIPQFFIYPLIGSFVDNADRRRLLWGICGVKILLVLTFIPFLWQVNDPGFQSRWGVLLVIILLLSLITVPFGPARAASIPDVVSKEQLGIAASLIATTGLVSILTGTTLGSLLAARLGGWLGFADEDRLGPLLVIPITSVL